MASENSIGKLTLDISDIDAKIKKINESLKSLGAGVKVDLSKQISTEVKKQLDSLQKEIDAGSKKIKDAAQKAVDAINQIGNAKASGKESKLMEQLEQKVLAYENKMQAEADKATAKMEASYAKQVAAAERAEERRRAAHEKTELMYEKLFRQSELREQAAEERRIAAVERETQKRTEMYTQMFDTIRQNEERANQQQTEMYTLMFVKQEQEALNSIIAQYKEYFEWKSKAYSSEASGNQAGADEMTQNAHQAYEEIQRLTQLYPDLARIAEASDEVRRAQTGWLNTITSAAAKEAANNVKQNEQAVTEYANALATVYNEQTKLNNALASGRIQEGSSEYDAAVQKIQNLENAATQAGLKLDEAGVKAARGMQQVTVAADNLVQSEARLNDVGQTNFLEQTQTAYTNLTNAIKNYTIAKRASNEDGMQYWQDQINNAMGVIGSIEQIIDSLDLEAGVRQQIITLIEQAKTQQDAFSKGITSGTVAASELESQLSGLMMRMFSLMAVIRTINNLISNTVDYVSEYSDKMNEIQMITLKSNSEIDQLGKRYRQIAEDMNVSSLDMADAAIYFTRQGLAAEEIERRLKNVTMYAKTANVEFKESSEIITSVVNSMNLVEQEMEDGRNATQRVADVFLAVGDSAATSGEEIGQAMQKAAASAGAFGMSFEWLASYIATVSETTRQEARTIGTAFNTIIARLHQIKQNGYNSEDETKINDVQKALAKIGITLMDNNNEWRDMDVIFQEIGDKWGELDGKTKSYIATTMAGVKQQNVFLALMNDLGQGIGNGSRAWELYEKAINSAGTAEEKYSVYLDSVTASQERLTVAQENFYASLMDDSVIVKWNDALSGFINTIATGAEKLGAWGTIVPVVIGALAALVIAMQKVDLSLTAMMGKHPVLMAIAAGVAVIAGLVTTINAIASAVTTSKEQFENSTNAITEYTDKINSLKTVQEKTGKAFSEFGEKTQLSSEDLSKHNGLLEELCKVSPAAAKVVGELREGIISQKDALQLLNEELEKQIEYEEKMRTLEGVKRFANYQDSEKISNIRSYLGYEAPFSYDWVDSLKNMGDFSKWLFQGYSDYNDPESSRIISEDLYKRVKSLVESYKFSDLSTEEQWGQIGELIWYEMFGTFDMSSNPLDTLTEQVNQEIEYALNTIGGNMTSGEMFSLKTYLNNLIFGEDGELSFNEYSVFSQKISHFLIDVMNNGVKQYEADSASVLNQVGTEMFGNYFDMMFDADTIAEVANDPEKVRAISEAYTYLLNSGFNEQMLANFYRNIDLSQWDQAIEYMKNEIRGRIAEISKSELGEWNEDLDTGSKSVDFLMWNNLDVSTLKTIENMVAFGIELDDIKQAMKDSESIEEFKEKLENLGVEAGYIPDEFGQTTTSLKDMVKEIKNASEDIEMLSDAINKIKSGDTLSFDEIMSIADAHPEFLLALADIGTMTEKLEELKTASEEAFSERVKNMLLYSSEIMQSSPFSEYMTDEITNMAQYMNSLKIGSAEYEEATKWVEDNTEAIVDSAEALKEDSEATETWLQKKVKAQKEAKALNEAVANNYKNQIQSMLDIYFSDRFDEQLGSGIVIENMMKQWNSYFDAMKDGISDTYPELAEAMLNLEEVMGDENATIEEQEKALTQLREALLNARDAEVEVDSSSFSVSMKDVEETTKDIEAMQAAIDAIDNQEAISGDDLINLAQAHPELINYINDIDALRKKLTELKEEQTEWRKQQLQEMIWQSPEYLGLLSGTSQEGAMGQGYESLADYANDLDITSDEYKEVVALVNSAVENILTAEQGLKGAEESWLAAQVAAQEAAEELKEAEENGFRDQMKAMLNPDEFEVGGSNAYDVWDSFSDDMKTAFGKAYPEVQKAILAFKTAIDTGVGAEEAALALANALQIAMASIPDDQLQKDLDSVKDTREEIQKLDNAIKTIGEGKKLSFNDMIDLIAAHPEIMAVIGDIDALKAKLEELRNDSSAYDSALTNLFMNNGAFMGDYSEYYDPEGKNGKGPINNLQQLKEAMPELAADIDAYVGEMVETAKQGFDAVDEATEDFLQKQVASAEEAAELQWAKTNGYIEQINELNTAIGEGGEEGATKALEIWNGYSEALQQAIIDQYPDLGRAMLDMRDKMEDTAHTAEDAKNSTDKLSNAMKRATTAANAKYFKDTFKAISDLQKGTTSATKAYETFNKQVEKVKKAGQEVVNVNDKISKSEERTEDDVKSLAEVLGLPAEQILADWPAAEKMFNDLIGSTGEMQAAFDALNNAAFIRITGTSDADFSAIEAGLISVENLAEEAVKALAATGQWKLETMDTPQTAAVWHPGQDGGGFWSYETKTGTASYLVPTGNNPFGGGGSNAKTTSKGKGGGGGGGGGGKQNTKSESSKMLDQMNAVNEIQEWQQSFYQSQQKYYESTGQLQGVIKYLQLESDAIKEQSATLEENVRRIDEQLAAKRAELATLKEGSDAYNQCEKDIDELQKAHQKYTKTLVDNKTAEENLTQAIKEQNDKIRDMEIDLRETIYKAIEDRERKRVDMLNAEVELENTILDIIKHRYEVERDSIIDTTNRKIDALREERDLLSEQLELRKKQNEEEDKAAQLAELEAQYKRISADPTRAKEALQIRKKIDDLRKEMAWDAAEDEVKAQQDSIDQQITSLEDYIEQVQEYYEDLFEHPQKLIEEMRNIMGMTDDEIIEWLMNNDEEYANASDNRRQQIIEGWQEMIDEMRGTVKTYWDEVEDIISKGDEFIINFLKENSAEYAAAGKLQAEKFVDEWVKKLEDLKKAHEDVAASIANTYDAIVPEDSGSGSSGGGSGGGNGSKFRFKATLKYINTDYGQKTVTANGDYKSTEADAKADALAKAKKQAQNYRDTVSVDYVAYKKGGKIDFTGPAWVDGSKTDPEAILNPYQTKLFESFVQALEKMSKISIPTMPDFGSLDLTGAGGMSVGDIIVNVDNLDTDDDYETLAKKVSEILMERIGRTAVVGGIRIN